MMAKCCQEHAHAWLGWLRVLAFLQYNALIIFLFFSYYSLGEVCSHVAAILFKLEDKQRALSQASCMSLPCEWNKAQSKKVFVPYSISSSYRTSTRQSLHFQTFQRTIVEIDFEKPKLSFIQRNEICAPAHKRPPPKMDDVSVLIKKLKTVNSRASIHTITSPKKPLCFDLPPPLTQLYDVKYLAMSKTEFSHVVDDTIKNIKLTALEIDAIEKMTKRQASSYVWREQRHGRLTSSMFGEIFKTSLQQPSASLLKQVIGQSPFLNSKAVKWGKESEKIALQEYEDFMKKYHVNFSVSNSGLIVHSEHGFIASSPDGIVNCDCHGWGLVEIKCPYSLIERHPCSGENDYIKPHTSAYPYCPNVLNVNHKYHYQIQGQLNVHKDATYCHFVCWTPKGMHVEIIKKNSSFFYSVLSKLVEYFKLIVLPELMTKSFTTSGQFYGISPAALPQVADSNTAKCQCGGDKPDKIIICANEECSSRFYHISCAGYKRGPRGIWHCKQCKKSKNKK